jgi:hypothetical protein
VGASVGIVLFILGAGIGLSSISPWGGASATSFGIGAAIWLIVIEWASAGVGGYIAGRLRTKWVAVHTHEVFFRDTAHGAITWALGTVIIFALFASSLTALISSTTGAATAVASGVVQGASKGATSALPDLLSGGGGYFSDLLFRPNLASSSAASGGTSAAPAVAATTGTAAPAPAATSPAAAAPSVPNTTGVQAGAPTSTTESQARGEGTQILLHAITTGSLSGDDRTYLAQLVARQTGLSVADAEARVDGVVKQVQDASTAAKNAADGARKAAAAASLFFALSLFIGAFIACVAAAIGGRERDEAERAFVT